MFKELQKKEDFYIEYINLLAMRTAYSNISMESRNADLSLPAMALPVKNYKDATMHLFENQDEDVKIYPSMMQKINTIINRGQFLPEGYRRVEVVTGLNFEAIPARNVANRILLLIDNYYNVWTDLSPYEREAKFALNFIRIQPFEDGNKRTANILVNYNLCKAKCAPAIINKEQTPEFLRCIEEFDEAGLTKVFKEASIREYHFMFELYTQLYPNAEPIRLKSK